MPRPDVLPCWTALLERSAAVKKVELMVELETAAWLLRAGLILKTRNTVDTLSY